MVSILILAAAAVSVAILLVVRLWQVLRPLHVTPRESLRVLIVAGSGGHTTEILRLVGSLSRAYSPRYYVIAESDEMSAKKIHSFERARAERDSTNEVCDHFLPTPPLPNSKKSGGPSVLAFLNLHHLAVHVVLLPPDLPKKAGFASTVIYCLSFLPTSYGGLNENGPHRLIESK
ncbi:UDP-N-acetylglucosamine transferase subunit ALG14 homolog isoform X2 [Meriones unguiculatus]|uniref:UDP-N-acetylglucosamine transferase subunit ALG14 homolog isoform X2 n=1 Tax=Meriones unguiculatus TaxID=10047 RepID=UPI00293F1F53|nr:UDP-N-acetylglucosamine transferase subunit ALG14 homolog isoform X2 [Meriones unguiculatus]